MKPTQHISAPPGPNGSPSAVLSPSDGGPADGSAARSGTAVRRTWVLGPLAMAVPVSLWCCRTRGRRRRLDRRGLARGGALDDHGEFRAGPLAGLASRRLVGVHVRRGPAKTTMISITRPERAGTAYLRNQADDEALMREDERFLKDHDHNDSRT